MVEESAEVSSRVVEDREALSRRVSFVLPRRPTCPPTHSVRVRVLNPLPDIAETTSQTDNEAGFSAFAATAVADGSRPNQAEPYLYSPNKLIHMLHWKTIRGIGPGLANVGQTSYVNAVLQASLSCLAK